MCRPQGAEYMYVSNLIVYLAKIDAIFTFLYISLLAYGQLFDVIATALTAIVRLDVQGPLLAASTLEFILSTYIVLWFCGLNDLILAV